MFIFGRKKKRNQGFAAIGFKKNRNSMFFRKKKQPKLKFLTVFLLCAGLAYFVLFSQYLRIKNINIENNRNIKTEDIIKSVNDKLSDKIAGIIPLNNYFLVNGIEISSFLKEKYPAIDSISVNAKPYNSLIISIIEKNPDIIWCRYDECFYVDNEAIAFENVKNELITNASPIKIYEQEFIEDEKESGDAVPHTANEIDENETKKNDNQTAKLPPLKINDKVADKEFLDFLIELNRNISASTGMVIKHYKTKGPKTREVIAYTDKNIRIYFDTTKSANSQTEYLKSFLDQGIEREKIENLQYIYVKADNKIFYK